MTASTIVESISISSVWRMLGGQEIKRARGKAFWRDGDGWSVSLDNRKGTWFDFRAGVGGGVLDLIRHVRGGSRQDALFWLADATGLHLDDQPTTHRTRADWQEHRRCQREAICFGDAALVMAEDTLESLSSIDPARATYTALVRAIHIAPRETYVRWRQHQPKLTAALVYAGRQRQRRMQHMLAYFLAAEVRRVA